jgi:hypothetical protein
MLKEERTKIRAQRAFTAYPPLLADEAAVHRIAPVKMCL